MAQVLLKSDTKATDFGFLTPIDIELDSVILELFYLACLIKEYGPKAGDVYTYHYGGQVKRVTYQNPFDILGFFKNIPKHSAEFILSRTVFYKQECEKRQAEADKTKAEAEAVGQTVIQKKLENLDRAHKLRKKMIKDGTDFEEAAKLVGGLLVDQRATLLLDHDKPD
jgi:hypothetical protein